MAISHPSFIFMLLYKQFTTSFSRSLGVTVSFTSFHLSILLPRWSAPEHAV